VLLSQPKSSQSGKVDATSYGNIIWHHDPATFCSLATFGAAPFGAGKSSRGEAMKDQPVRLGPREQQIVELLLQGCDNAEIASQLKMARRTVKAHFNRLFLRFGITDGIKRVKLATLLYRRQSCMQLSVMEVVPQVSGSSRSSSLSHKA
ncbi:MAG: helix-turn-helix transcriptional regulator, partial [Candidatus Sulfotelmatobacter sp.]